MTKLNKYKDDEEQLEELLLKNLPKRIKSGNDKHLSNIYEYSSAKSLREHKFINFNSKSKLVYLVFDIDKYEDKTALEYFKDIDNFLEYITDNIGLEPTYILETKQRISFCISFKKSYIYSSKKSLINM